MEVFTYRVNYLYKEPLQSRRGSKYHISSELDGISPDFS